MNYKIHAGNWILYIAGLFLAFIFSLLFLFMKENLSLSSVNYYADELKVEDTKKALLAGNDFLADVRIEKSGQSLLINFPGEFDFSNVAAEIKLFYPSSESLDRTIQLVPGEKRQFIPLQSVLPVMVTLAVVKDGKSYLKKVNF